MIDNQTGFEIFRDFGEDAEPQRVAFAKDLQNAETILRRMATNVPGRYLIWDPAEAEVVSQVDNSFRDSPTSM